VAKNELREFYSKHFIPQMPPDTKTTPVSRTIGKDQLVDGTFREGKGNHR